MDADDRRSTSTRKLDELRKCDAQMEADVSRRFDTLQQDVLDAFSQKLDNTKHTKQLSTLLKAMLDEAPHASMIQEILVSTKFEGISS